MAQPAVDNGTGTTLSFGTSTWTAEIVNIEHSGVKREEIDTTHLGSTNARTNMPGDLYDPGEYDIEYHFNPDKLPPYTATAEAVTITYPLAGTITTASHDTVNMWVKEWGKTIPLEGKMVGKAKLRCTGPFSHTNAA